MNCLLQHGPLRPPLAVSSPSLLQVGISNGLGVTSIPRSASAGNSGGVVSGKGMAPGIPEQGRKTFGGSARLVNVTSVEVSEREKSIAGQHTTRSDVGSLKTFAAVAGGQKRTRPLKRVEANLSTEGGVIIPHILAEKGATRWKNALIAVMLGRRIPLSVIEQNVRRMWRRWGVVEVGFAGVGMVFIRFADDVGFEEILRRGD